MNLRDAILAADDKKVQRVETPEWPGIDAVYVRTLSARERLNLAAAQEANKGEGKELTHGRLAAAAICDEHGLRIFIDEDAAQLAEKSGAVIQRIVRAWLDLNGMSAATTEEKEKNS